MPKMKSVEKKIWDVEGFDVVVKDSNGTDIRSDRGGIPQYDKKIAAKNSMTVSDWKKKRFNTQYPGFKVDVINGDGEIASGQTLLGTVRDSYREDEEE